MYPVICGAVLPKNVYFNLKYTYLNQIIEENKSGLELNFPSKSKCASLNF